MTTLSKQLIINNLKLPKELLYIIKDFAFYSIKKIPKNDKRYEILLQIPCKEYDPSDDVTYVYMNINQEKDYFLTYANFEIQLQTLLYVGDIVHGLEGHSVIIE